jgi:predicted metal-dependent TIM-barrel fold hydrolase
MVSERGPTARETGVPPETGESPAPVDMPWVDIHQHTQSLTWNDREKFDLSGAEAAVMIAAGYYWSPYRPVEPADVRFLWDDALRRAASFDHRHFYTQYVACAVHTWSRVEEPETLLAALPEYCAHDRVVAVGETGIESTQHTAAWDLDDQRDVVREQFHIAREAGLPVLVHTPGSDKGALPGWYAHSYEEGNRNFTEPVLDPENAKREAVEIDLALADEAGLADEQVVIDHASPDIAPLVLETTDCYLSFSVSAPWLRGIDPADIAETIETYGPDRIVLDTDLIGAMENDPFAMKRTVFDLLRLGVDREAVRQVVYENPRRVLGI